MGQLLLEYQAFVFVVLVGVVFVVNDDFVALQKLVIMFGQNRVTTEILLLLLFLCMLFLFIPETYLLSSVKIGSVITAEIIMTLSSRW